MPIAPSSSLLPKSSTHPISFNIESSSTFKRSPRTFSTNRRAICLGRNAVPFFEFKSWTMRVIVLVAKTMFYYPSILVRLNWTSKEMSSFGASRVTLQHSYSSSIFRLYKNSLSITFNQMLIISGMPKARL